MKMCGKTSLVGPVSYRECRLALLDYSTTAERRVITPERVMAVVCDYFACTPGIVTGPRLDRQATQPRHMLVYFLKKVVGKTFVQIAELVGNRTNQTVNRSYLNTCKQLLRDEALQKQVAELRAKMYKRG